MDQNLTEKLYALVGQVGAMTRRVAARMPKVDVNIEWPERPHREEPIDEADIEVEIVEAEAEPEAPQEEPAECCEEPCRCKEHGEHRPPRWCGIDPGAIFGGRGPDRPFRGPRPSMARMRILGILSETSGISQNKLAMILNIRPQSLSEIIGKMEAEGLVERRKSDQDKRATLVYITESGRKAAEDAESRRRSFADDFFAPLTEEEQETLFALLEKLVKSREDKGNR